MKLTKSFVVSDLHGCFVEFTELLSKIEYNPKKDKLYLLGDYISKGPNSKECVEKVIELVEKYGAVALSGNHEELVVDFLYGNSKESDTFYWVNGGKEFFESYFGPDISDDYKIIKGKFLREYKEHVSFFKNLKNYHELDKYILVHAGIDPSKNDWKDTTSKDFRWIRSEFDNNPIKTDKRVIFGHTITSNLNMNKSEFNPWFSPCGKKIGIDGGCSIGGQLNCIELIGDEIVLHHVNSSI